MLLHLSWLEGVGAPALTNPMLLVRLLLRMLRRIALWLRGHFTAKPPHADATRTTTAEATVDTRLIDGEEQTNQRKRQAFIPPRAGEGRGAGNSSDSMRVVKQPIAKQRVLSPGTAEEIVACRLQMQRKGLIQPGTAPSFVLAARIPPAWHRAKAKIREDAVRATSSPTVTAVNRVPKVATTTVAATTTHELVVNAAKNGTLTKEQLKKYPDVARYLSPSQRAELSKFYSDPAGHPYCVCSCGDRVLRSKFHKCAIASQTFRAPQFVSGGLPSLGKRR